MSGAKKFYIKTGKYRKARFCYIEYSLIDIHDHYYYYQED